MKKTGGIWFWKMGRFGGSFYISKAKSRKRIWPLGWEVVAAIAIGFPAGIVIADYFL